MTDFIKAKNFTKGRPGPVRVVVIHSAETPCSLGVARKVAEWFAGADAPQASAHAVVGPDEIVACVSEGDTAWHAGPPTNEWSIGVEHTGRAAFTAADWASDDAKAMLQRSAALVADICSRHAIPVAFLDAAALQRGEAGITTHAEVTKAFHHTTHTDPGPHFPIDDYLAAVQAALVVPASDPGAAADTGDTYEPTSP